MNKKERTKARQEYAGAAIDKADHDETRASRVRQETRRLNNNPRNTDQEMP